MKTPSEIDAEREAALESWFGKDGDANGRLDGNIANDPGILPIPNGQTPPVEPSHADGRQNKIPSIPKG